MSPRRNDAESRRAASRSDRLREWFLLDGHRAAVAGATAVAIFVPLAVVALSGITPLGSVQPLFYVFGGLITGNLTVITVVVSINQLLLSRELGTPDEFRSEIESVVDYRREVEEAVGRPVSVEPQEFLRQLYEAMRGEAQGLGGLTFSETDDGAYDEIDEVVSTLTDRADRVDDLLRTSGTSTFAVLSTTLTTNYAREIHRLRQIQDRYGEGLPERVVESIDDLVHRLEDIDVARQYFKSIYLEEELSVLSRGLFYVGLPSVVIVAVGLYLLTSERGAALPGSYLHVVVPAITTVGLLPIVVLFAFVLRIATVTQRTAATLPFTTSSQEQ